MDNPGFSTAKGTQLIMYRCKPLGEPKRSNQQWQFEHAGVFGGQDYYRIRNNSSQLCANIEAQSHAIGARAILWDCNPWDPNGFFRYRELPGGNAMLIALHSGLCLKPSALVSGKGMVQGTCDSLAEVRPRR